MNLFKWIFTILAILWIIQAMKPFFHVSQTNNPQPPPQPPPPYGNNGFEDAGDYIDYEEINNGS